VASIVHSPNPTGNSKLQAIFINEVFPDDIFPITTLYRCPSILFIGSVNLIFDKLSTKAINAFSFNSSYFAGSCNFLAYTKASSYDFCKVATSYPNC